MSLVTGSSQFREVAEFMVLECQNISVLQFAAVFCGVLQFQSAAECYKACGGSQSRHS